MKKEKEQGNSAQLEDIYLAEFKTSNPQCKYKVEDNKFIIDNAWNTDEVQIEFDIDNLESLKDLNHIEIRPQFDAIIHKDTNEIEFVFGLLPPDIEPYASYIDRAFTFHYLGNEYTCTYREPTERLLLLAEKIRHYPGADTSAMKQIRSLRDSRRIDKLPKQIQKIFEENVLRSFFVKSNLSFDNIDLPILCRHINFHMNYYDRATSHIIIRESITDTIQKTKFKRFIAESFPETLLAHPIDEFILQLIEVARESNPRFAFIYYYQVLEYAGFYFVDEKAKKEIRQFLRDPAMMMCAEEKINELLSVLSDLHRGDDAKMIKVVEEYCDPIVVWQEIESDREFFEDKVTFEGGFELPPLISKDLSIDGWKAMWMPKLYHQLTKIRNCLVHARERRQAQVIAPCTVNTTKIEHYLPVIARMAEQIALSKV